MQRFVFKNSDFVYFNNLSSFFGIINDITGLYKTKLCFKTDPTEDPSVSKMSDLDFDSKTKKVERR